MVHLVIIINRDENLQTKWYQQSKYNDLYINVYVLSPGCSGIRFYSHMKFKIQCKLKDKFKYII